MRVIFILPVRGGGGGVHSVVQEVLGLRRAGVDAVIATSRDTLEAFGGVYPDLAEAGAEVRGFDGEQELQDVMLGFDLVLATTAPSAHLVAAALKGLAAAKHPAPKAGYYVQDYEPFFFPPGGAAWQRARDSYRALPADALLFAKTDWLCAMVERNHGIAVRRVKASLDHATYRPDFGRQAGPLSISAMVRPETPRRAPRRTLRIMERLAAEFGDRVSLTVFGCEDGDIPGAGLSPAISNRGVLSRSAVAQVLRGSDMFLDLSDYQAFGRTGLEAMACGCVPVLPLFGGAGEYARHRRNAFLVDTRSDEAIMAAIVEFMGDGDATRARMRKEALTTALGYSVERAVQSEHQLFEKVTRAG